MNDEIPNIFQRPAGIGFMFMVRETIGNVLYLCPNISSLRCEVVQEALQSCDFRFERFVFSFQFGDLGLGFVSFAPHRFQSYLIGNVLLHSDILEILSWHTLLYEGVGDGVAANLRSKLAVEIQRRAPDCAFGFVEIQPLGWA